MTTARRYVALVALAGTATSCAARPVTLEGAEVEGLYRFFFYFAVVIFIVVAGLIGWSILRFRATDDELPEQVHHSVALEIMWFAIPTVIVIVLFFFSMGVLDTVNETNPEDDGTVTVTVDAFQWGWRFTYPGDKIVESLPERPAEIHLPTDTSITFLLGSADVIHSFYVPRFMLKRDVVPGRTNRIDLTIDEAGSYGGKCAEFCGLLHDSMDFTIEAVAPDSYESWLQALPEGVSDGG